MSHFKVMMPSWCKKRLTRFFAASALSAAGMMFLPSPFAAAQSVAAATEPDTTSLVARYPAGSIQSVEAADAALSEMDKERSQIEARFTAEEQACYPKFFITSCVDKAKERKRQALSQVRKVELEANAFKRHARVQEREKAAADRQVKEEANRLERIRPQQEDKDDLPQEEPQAIQKPSGNAFPDREARHEAKLKRLEADEMASAQKRAEKAAAYERKMQAAQERQRKVAQRKAEKEAKRRAKEASKATPESQPSPASPAISQ